MYTETDKSLSIINQLLAEADKAAEYGNVGASDGTLKELSLQESSLGTEVLGQISEIRKKSRLNAIDKLLEQAEWEAEAAFVVDSDYTTSMIREYASEAGICLTDEQESRMGCIFKTARVNAIDEAVVGIEELSKRLHVESIDANIERIFRYADEAKVELPAEQEEQLQRAFRTVRKKTLKRAIKQDGPQEDVETLRQYAEEAGIKFSAKHERKIQRG